MKIISVDGGTTNTRLTLIEKGKIIQTVKLRIGAGNQRAGAEENPYIAPLRAGVAELLQAAAVRENEIDAMVFSGMICSENGLCEIPHVAAPASVGEIASGLVERRFPEIADIPMYFVPGLKTVGKAVADTDIMRGEETELFGIFAVLGLRDFLAVMPGSHTKIVKMGAGGRIETFHTALTGELIRSTAEHTILQTGLRDVFPRTTDPAWLMRGYDVCRERGLNQALFGVRIQQKFADVTPEQLFSFHCGVCMTEDVRAVAETAGKMPVFVGGSDPFRSAYVTLLREKESCNAQPLPDDLAEHAAAYGAEALMEIKE